MMLKKLYTGTLLILCAAFLTGCWDIKDLNHRVLPIVMGISKGKTHKYRLHIQIPLPERNRLISKVYYKEADTISKALTEIDTDIEAGIDFMHVQLIVIDRKVAEEGIQDEVAFIMRSQQIPSKALLAITSEEMGELLTRTGNVIQNEESALINFFNKNAGWSPEINLAYIWNAFGAIHSDTEDITIPILRSGKSTMLEFLGSAVMAKGQMKGDIEKEQSLLINLFEELFEGSVVQVMGGASVAIVKCKNDLHTEWREQHPFLRMNMRLSLHLIENNDKRSEHEIEEAFSKDIKTRYEELFKHLKKLRSDALGIGQHFRSKLPLDQLPNWRQMYYPNLETEMNIKCNISNSGDIRSN
ncbi:Ger(x)C family spore germination protein [Paenibacillus cremeus]|uniref:Ger(X)C family spore germination protein n=1 Tax=Paenibacillus cremeus TaxID=2163881 RepID=A0A559KGJ7_9BACL|nr:Ger(x)C family spore germination protein [Paenibacillus cremeus]TVY11253.1 Ger(x)C family spore germination protein [Paenibacillus cremeus]